MSDHMAQHQFDKDYLGEFPPIDRHEVLARHILEDLSGNIATKAKGLGVWLKEHDQQIRDKAIEDVAQMMEKKPVMATEYYADRIRNMKGEL